MSAQFHTLRQGPIQTCRSGPKGTVLHAKTSSEVYDPQRLVILVLKSLFCMQKKHRLWLEHTQTCHSGAKVAVLKSQNRR